MCVCRYYVSVCAVHSHIQRSQDYEFHQFDSELNSELNSHLSVYACMYVWGLDSLQHALVVFFPVIN